LNKKRENDLLIQGIKKLLIKFYYNSRIDDNTQKSNILLLLIRNSKQKKYKKKEFYYTKFYKDKIKLDAGTVKENNKIAKRIGNSSACQQLYSVVTTNSSNLFFALSLTKESVQAIFRKYQEDYLSFSKKQQQCSNGSTRFFLLSKTCFEYIKSFATKTFFSNSRSKNKIR